MSKIQALFHECFKRFPLITMGTKDLNAPSVVPLYFNCACMRVTKLRQALKNNEELAGYGVTFLMVSERLLKSQM